MLRTAFESGASLRSCSICGSQVGSSRSTVVVAVSSDLLLLMRSAGFLRGTWDWSGSEVFNASWTALGSDDATAAGKT